MTGIGRRLTHDDEENAVPAKLVTTQNRLQQAKQKRKIPATRAGITTNPHKAIKNCVAEAPTNQVSAGPTVSLPQSANGSDSLAGLY
jgi:hypothetical protein